MRRPTGLVLGVCLSLELSACADLTRMVGDLGGSGPLTDETIVRGLREALEVGSRHAVARTSRDGGFRENPALRVAIPGELQDLAKGLRTIGLGSLVDRFETQMNVAAEHAAAEAAPVFVDAIREMTFEDARAILGGSDTAATAYFRQKTEPKLRALFGPVVNRQLGELGVLRDYDALLARYEAIPFTSKPDLSLEHHVTAKALDGLFSALADEERKIREDPVARTTELLRRVFASAGGAA